MPSDALAAARARARDNRFWSHLGVHVEDAREGWIRLRLGVRPELCNAAGAPLHGGIYAALVDMAVGGALRSIAFGEARLTDAGGRLLAVGRATYMILTRG